MSGLSSMVIGRTRISLRCPFTKTQNTSASKTRIMCDCSMKKTSSYTSWWVTLLIKKSPFFLAKKLALVPSSTFSAHGAKWHRYFFIVERRKWLLDISHAMSHAKISFWDRAALNFHPQQNTTQQPEKFLSSELDEQGTKVFVNHAPKRGTEINFLWSEHESMTCLALELLPTSWPIFLSTTTVKCPCRLKLLFWGLGPLNISPEPAPEGLSTPETNWYSSRIEHTN